MLALFRGLRTTFNRWRNRRKRIRPVYTWARFDNRDWSQSYYHSATRR